MFVSLTSGEVATAVHGVGRWKPTPMASDLTMWRLAMSRWLDLFFGVHGGHPFDRDGVVLTSFEDGLREQLGPIVGTRLDAWLAS